MRNGRAEQVIPDPMTKENHGFGATDQQIFGKTACTDRRVLAMIHSLKITYWVANIQKY